MAMNQMVFLTRRLVAQGDPEVCGKTGRIALSYC